MNIFASSDRENGPKSISEVSISAKRRWKEKAENLLDRTAYRPKTLHAVAAALDALSAANVGVGIPMPPETSFRIYEVKQGDALRKIALRELGSADRADEISQLNRDKIDDPNRIFEIARHIV